MIAGGLTKRGTIMSTSTARLTYYNGYLWHVVLLPGGTRAAWPSLDGPRCRARRRATTAGPPGSAAARTAAGHRPGIGLTASSGRPRRDPSRISEADPGPDCAVFRAGQREPPAGEQVAGGARVGGDGAVVVPGVAFAVLDDPGRRSPPRRPRARRPGINPPDGRSMTWHCSWTITKT